MSTEAMSNDAGTDETLRSSYRAGGWFGIFGESATVLLPPSEKTRVAPLWELIDDGAGFDEVLDALLSTGLRDLPGFVLISALDRGTKIVLRGPAVAAFVAGGEMVQLAGSTETTWVERTFTDVTQLFVQVEPTEDEGEDLVIGAGLVRVARIEQPPYAAEPEEEAQQEAPEEPVADEEAFPEAPAPVAAAVVLAADEPAPEVAAGEPYYGEPHYDEPHYDEPQDVEADSEQPHDEQPEDVQPHDEQPEDVQPEDVQPEDVQPEEELSEDEQPEDVQPQHGEADYAESQEVEAFVDAEVAEASSYDAPPTPEFPEPTEALPDDYVTEDLGTSLDAADPVADTEDPIGEAFAPAGPFGGYAPVPPPLPQPDTDAWAPAPGPASIGPVARLLFSSGQVLDVDGPVLIGRAPEPRRINPAEHPQLVPVPSPHQEISSTHLEIRPGVGADQGSAVATDLGSTNGTVLVQPGLPPEDLQPGLAVQLLPGAIIDLGDGLTIQVTTV